MFRILFTFTTENVFAGNIATCLTHLNIQPRIGYCPLVTSILMELIFTQTHTATMFTWQRNLLEKKYFNLNVTVTSTGSKGKENIDCNFSYSHFNKSFRAINSTNRAIFKSGGYASILLECIIFFQRGGVKDKLLTVSVYNPGILYFFTFDVYFNSRQSNKKMNIVNFALYWKGKTDISWEELEKKL